MGKTIKTGSGHNSKRIMFDISTSTNAEDNGLSKIRISHYTDEEFSIRITLNSFDELESLGKLIQTHIEAVNATGITF